ncbi:MAG: MFS transporter [Alphaproteobacteria bacterium]
MTVPATAEPSRRAIYATYAVGFFTNGFGMIMLVIIPLWVAELGLTAVMIGFVIGIRSLLPLVFTIHGGALMDRFGTGRVVLILGAMTAVLSFLYPAFPGVGPLIAIQMLIGLSGSICWLGAQTLLGQQAPGSSLHAGRFTFCSRSGTLMAPLLIGGAWDVLGPWGAFSVMGLWASGIVIAVLALPRLPITTPAKPAGLVRWRDLAPKRSYYMGAFALFAVPTIAFAVILSFVRVGISGMQGSFYVVYLVDIGITGTLIGVLLTGSEACNAFAALGAGRMTRFIAPHWLLLGCFALAVVMMTITPVLGVFALFMAASCARGGFQGLGQVVNLSILSHAAGPTAQGITIGLRATMDRLASLVVPIFMGLAVDAAGIENSFYITGGGLLLITAGFGWWALKCGLRTGE